MTKSAKEIFEQAMALNSDEREALAEQLLSSLANQSDSHYTDAWEKELERRVADIESGRVQGIPLEDVIQRLEKRRRA